MVFLGGGGGGGGVSTTSPGVQAVCGKSETESMFHGDKLDENKTYMYTVYRYVKVLSTHIFIAGNFVNI